MMDDPLWINEAAVEAQFLRDLSKSWRIAVADDSLPKGNDEIPAEAEAERPSRTEVLLIDEMEPTSWRGRGATQKPGTVVRA